MIIKKDQILVEIIDNDPNIILFDTIHEISVNDFPQKRTFYCQNTPPEECDDRDWVYFYAEEGHIYEIYAQDLSEYGYFIGLGLYDPNIRPL